MVNLEKSPVPDYSDYVDELARTGFKNRFDLRLYFESSRGCWWGAKHHCTFCGLNGSGMSFRKKNADQVYSEIVHLSQTYHCLKLAATDNIMAVEYFSQLLPKLASLNADIEFFYEVKANLTREQVRLLAAAGVKEIQPGIESFNSRILNLMRKGVTAIQNIQLLKWCCESQIDPFWNILFGFPGEVPDDYAYYPTLLCQLSHLRPPTALVRVRFERFSPYHYEREKFGLELRPSSIYQLLFPESRMDHSKLAYFFDGECRDQLHDPDEHIKPVNAAAKMWVENWNADRVYCYYSRGEDYIIIHDNRPPSTDAALVPRRIYLSNKVSAIYCHCDEIRSSRSVCEMMTQQFGPSVSPSQVCDWLDRLVQQRLMFREGERYLSLAVHRPPSRRRKSVLQGEE